MNINKIYDTIETKVTALTGTRPNATEKLANDLGLDSLDNLEIIWEVEREHNVSISGEVVAKIPADATLLDLAILLTFDLNDK